MEQQRSPELQLPLTRWHLKAASSMLQALEAKRLPAKSNYGSFDTLQKSNSDHDIERPSPATLYVSEHSISLALLVASAFRLRSLPC